MSKIGMVAGVILLALGTLISSFADVLPEKSVEVRLSLSDAVCTTPLTGRVYVLFDPNVYARPLRQFELLSEQPLFAVDVHNWTCDSAVSVNNDALGYPFTLNDLPDGNYVVQAILDTNTTGQNFAASPGNIYSPAVAASVRAGESNTIDIELSRTIKPVEFENSAFITEVKVASQLLSRFYNRPVTIDAAVLLPPSYYAEPEKKYATVFVFPGWGSTHYAMIDGDFQIRRYAMNLYGLEKIFVFFNQECPLGYHVFANSDNNGPWGSAFVEECIPQLEKDYRMIPAPNARFMTGQSSGAWAGLWLQTTFPEVFGGVWAVSPDPVDFSTFLNCNIYDSSQNFYTTGDGDIPMIKKLLCDQERVIGHGGQMESFEAVFGPRGDDGNPARLWDRTTGEIDPVVASAWKRYDLRLILENNWTELAPTLAGKIHIFVADNDPFGLDDPVRSLQQAMTAVKADIDINIVGEGGHNLWTNELKKRIHDGMDETIRATD